MINEVSFERTARLIAAAPDLLAERDRLRASEAELVEALEKIEQQLDYGQHGAAHRIALDALAKHQSEGNSK